MKSNWLILADRIQRADFLYARRLAPCDYLCASTSVSWAKGGEREGRRKEEREMTSKGESIWNGERMDCSTVGVCSTS